jgi:MoaA/NifB/PqqE/SkfB family radical SAM enzyme
MSLEGIERILDEFNGMGGSRVALWGGEPLVREDIGAIIRACRNRGFLTSMDTNGHLLPERLDDVAGLDVCVVSLDGDERGHDAGRGAGSYAKTIAGIESVLGRGIPVWTITVLNRHNLGSMEHVLGLANRMGFRTTWQVLHHQELASDSVEGMYPSDEETREAVRKLRSWKHAGRPIVNSDRYFRYLLEWPDFRVSTLGPARGGVDCSAARSYANVDTDGRVYPCSVLVDRMPALNALETGLAAAVAHVRNLPCHSCTAGCYIEYNHLYAFDMMSAFNWFCQLVPAGRRG